MNISNNNQGVGGNTQLVMYQPFNFMVFLSFYSPIILAVIMVSVSFLFQNFKGFIFLGFLLGVCILRNFIYMLNGAQPIINDKTICTSIQYSKYGNPTFSVFVFAFTIMYLSIPMFSNGSVNYWVLIGLLVYFFFDMFNKFYKGCIMNYGNLFINVLMGLTSSTLIVILMYLGGSSKYLFFNEIQSNKEVCSMRKTQTFKCNVYKNGELIGNV
uniref:Phosphatidic acid phosphatase type 2/haloperoxidase domain-containing protein n=1 Tax=viral metagenome TaxID=1070528 RepID=A0A6C0DGN2_9ZZZZ